MLQRVNTRLRRNHTPDIANLGLKDEYLHCSSTEEVGAWCVKMRCGQRRQAGDGADGGARLSAGLGHVMVVMGYGVWQLCAQVEGDGRRWRLWEGDER